MAAGTAGRKGAARGSDGRGPALALRGDVLRRTVSVPRRAVPPVSTGGRVSVVRLRKEGRRADEEEVNLLRLAPSRASRRPPRRHAGPVTTTGLRPETPRPVTPRVPSPVRQYRDQSGPLAVAHRGGAGLAPENTIEAFGLSTALGVGCLETDVRLTADGVLVAFHDETLDRVTDLRGRVRDVPWSVLSRAEVLGRGRVLRLDDLLGQLPDAMVTVDLKQAAAVGPFVEALRRTGSAGRVCVAGGWDGWLRGARERAGPDLASALGWAALSTLVGAARTGVRPPRAVATGGYAHVPWSLAGRPVMADRRLAVRLLSMAHDLGVRVLVWTVDDAADMHRLLDDGVDGVITDRPDLLREVLVARGSWAGSPR